MTFKVLALYLEKLEKTSSRLTITEILADLFKKTNNEEIDKVIYLLLGSLAPRYKSVVFNIAERMMLKAISQAFGVSIESVKALYRETGDLGQTAEKLSSEKGKNLKISDVFGELYEIASESGQGSQEKKLTEMAELLNKLDPLSARYVCRIPVGKLRLGFSDKTILDALSWMETGGKGKKAKLEQAYNILPDVGLLAREVKLQGIDSVSSNIKPLLGVPILPMLAQRLKSPKDMVEKMGTVYVEPKFDGLRIQIHYKKNPQFIAAYTRNLNETSWMFPELTEIGKYITSREVILDTEAVGVDEERKAMANFQSTMTRRRKHDISQMAKKVSIKFYVFDIMFKDGNSLVNITYDQRRQILAQCIKSGSLLEVVDFEVTDNPERINQLMLKQLKAGMEGIIVKKKDSGYIAGRTGWRWVKMKEEEGSKSKLADTLDCVILGYSAGKGKRAGFGIGQFLVGVRDQDKYKTVTKVGTGLSDLQFKELFDRLKEIKINVKPTAYEVNKLLEPDYWVSPEVVIEIAADEITKSPIHTSGLALRFPRLVKFRDDKSPEQATTLVELGKIYNLQ